MMINSQPVDWESPANFDGNGCGSWPLFLSEREDDSRYRAKLVFFFFFFFFFFSWFHDHKFQQPSVIVDKLTKYLALSKQKTGPTGCWKRKKDTEAIVHENKVINAFGLITRSASLVNECSDLLWFCLLPFFPISGAGRYYNSRVSWCCGQCGDRN